MGAAEITMIMGHYASALLPHSRDRQAPLALYLFLAICRRGAPGARTMGVEGKISAPK